MRYKNQIFYKTGEVPQYVDTKVDENGKESKAVVGLACFGESLSAITCDFPKGFTWVPHSHPHEQLCICMKGKLEYTINGETCVMEPGDTAYLPPNALHVAVAVEDCQIIDIFTPVRMDQMAWYDDSIVAESAFNKD